jgi:FkbM family methyltransferase
MDPNASRECASGWQVNMNQLKTHARRLLEYSGTGSWIYTARVLAWAFDASIVAQLPLGLRLYCAFVRSYCRIIGTPTILFGHGLYRSIRYFSNWSITQPTRLCIGTQEIWLHLGDPGSLWAIKELGIGSPLGSLIESLARHADFFVDVGANQGIFTAIASRSVNSSTTIFSIEPQPQLADCIERTLNASRLDKWKVFRTAVSDKSGVMELVVPGENQGEAHLAGRGPTTGASVIKTSVVLLDDLLSSIKDDQGVVVKMDVEGGELDALRGGKEFFKRCLPTLIMELNPDAMDRSGYSIEDIRVTLSELGYRQWSHVEDPHTLHQLDSLPTNYCDIVLPGRKSL